jgi:hypothetical protein
MAAFHKLHLGSVAASAQDRLDFFYRQPEATFKLFVHNVLPEHCQLLTPVTFACYLENRCHWTIQQSPFTDDYGFVSYWPRPVAGHVAELVGIEGGVVSGVINLESSGV